ncbi:MAG: Rrf2 family transcriptional regulator [Paracoccaceae bacterium]
MRLTTRTNLAARVLMYCAVNAGRTVRSVDIATACNASGNHLAQVIHQLQLQGFVATQRGRTGGLQLARPASDISVGTVFRTFEAGVPFAECFLADGNTCPLIDNCRLRNYISNAVEAFYQALDPITVDDLVRDNCGLSNLLEMRPQLEEIGCVRKTA